ncbi:glycoside hydrolase family protein [Geoalkalibacter sp.]|uniref:glycoside hydrolase family protein n=1 Tax=Geoalkalibacter sp. TaxID=3041440 RepID=UPI00272EDA82|nr:glycoside hydrolase family protein [Geoalkalibacter sp.]
MLETLLRLHEGERLKVYRCPGGKLTIGVGRNLEDRGITAEESAMLLRNDIADFRARLIAVLPWVRQLDEVRQAVLVDMAFNLGVAGLLNFRQTLANVQAGDYREAAAQMLRSRWADQVKTRAVRLSEMMRSGQWPRDL